jgi:hypothetical protein
VIIMENAQEHSLAMAVGELKGSFNTLAAMLQAQNESSSSYRKEQEARTEVSRTEFMRIFEGIRTDNKGTADLLAAHEKALGNFADWKQTAEPRVNTLWDKSNNQNGIIATIGALGTIIGGGIVAVMEYFHR